MILLPGQKYKNNPRIWFYVICVTALTYNNLKLKYKSYSYFSLESNDPRHGKGKNSKFLKYE